MIRFSCSHCNKALQVQDELADKRFTCPDCARVLYVPGKFGTVASGAGAPAQFPTIGRFEILGVLGEGAFGKVYRAHDPKLEREVALKVPRAGALGSADELERFLREAKAAAAFQHPNICPVYEVGQDGDTHFIVMAYVPGQSLADMIKARKTPMAPRQAALVVRKLALALETAHASGIIHRDLKPGNILYNRDRKDMVITDFGLARRVRDEDARLTRSGTVMGTPAYMAPEQAKGDGKAVGPRSDVYSLGVILYELLTGQRPFNGTVAEVIGQVLHVEPEPPSKHRPDLDEVLDGICLKAMAKNAKQRYGSMKAFAAALGDYLKGTAIAEPTSVAPKAATLSTSTASREVAELIKNLSQEHRNETAAAVAEAGRQARVPFWAWLSGAGFMGVLLLLGIFFIFAGRGLATIIIQVPLPPGIDLKDTSLAFFLDNKSIALDVLEKPIPLKAGDHELLIRRGDQVVKRMQFTVGLKGKEAFVEVKETGTLNPEEAWLKYVAGLPAPKQVEEVAAKLKERNPGFEGKVGPDGQVTHTIIQDGVVTELGLITDNVKDISPVRALTGLRNLTYAGKGKGQLADLSPLKDMKLTYLSCGGTQVADLSPLKDMKLTILRCHERKVKDLSPLKDMKLTFLDCTETQVKDLLPLKDMKLTELLCRDTQVADLSPLKDLKLTLLDCAYTQVIDLSPLKDMKLTTLECNATKVFDLSPLKDMKTLTSLNFSGSQVNDLSPLKDMKLTTLLCSYTKVFDLSPLKDMKLTTLLCGATKVFDLSPLKDMKTLTSLNFGESQVEDLSPLKDMKLTDLGCSYTQVSDLSPLKDMKLTGLGCSNTKVFDLSPLKDMKLTTLNCSGTKVFDLSPLKDMKLKDLGCSGTKVSDLSPLKDMKLTRLTCEGTKVSDLSVLKGMPLEHLSCDIKTEHDVEILRSLKTLEIINGKPVEEFWKEVDAKKKDKKP